MSNNKLVTREEIEGAASAIENMFYKNKIIILYHNVKTSIKNLINWFPIIWKDRNYDEYYIYTLLHHKLKNMERFFNSDKLLSDGKKISKEVKIARTLCERIINNDYLSNALIPYYKIYGELDDKFMWTKYNEETGFYEIVFTNNEEQRKLFRRCSKHSDYMKKQDIDYLHHYIIKKSAGWWD
jgi:hypothetical protein